MSRLKDFLGEDFMNTYRYTLVPGLTNDIDVFVNPSRKEFRETQQTGHNASRFILDNKKKKVYIWAALDALHRDMWEEIAKETKDSRRIYMTDDILVGVVDKAGKVKYESNYLYTLTDWERIYAADWKWANRYIKNLTSSLQKEPTNDM